MQESIFLVPFATPAYDEILALRDRILRKPLNMVFEIDDIVEEYDQKHFACFNEHNQLVGCLVFHILDDSVLKMRQVAIDTPFQGKGVGRRLVKASEDWALTNGYNHIVLNARDVALPFYKKMKYKKTGKPFEEVGIKHYKMEKKLRT